MSNASSCSSVYSASVHNPPSSTVSSIFNLIREYTESLTPFEQKGLAIAKEHLGPSFDMKRSSGFIRWKDAKDTKNAKYK
jgi:hypothetical protein